MKVFYSDTFVLPLPPGHRFPMAKYRRLRERLLTDGVVAANELHLPPATSDDQLQLVHTAEYVQRVARGALTPREIRQIGFPWSPAMVERSRRSTGATVAAAAAALVDGVAVSLAGGTHHAFADWAQGFCVFNDVAVAIRVHQRAGRVKRALVIDTDVHQGNGTAAIFAHDQTVFTFSMHGAKNFPFRKVPSDLDIALPDDTGDDAYLAALDAGLSQALGAARADFVVFVSGADPFVGDRLGKLALSKAALAGRDCRVLDACAARGLPVAVVMGGGYAPRIDDIVDVHLATVRAAAAARAAYRSPPTTIHHESARPD